MVLDIHHHAVNPGDISEDELYYNLWPKLIEDLKRMEACGEGVTVLDGGRVEIAPHNQH